jgi:hypothetical protein
MEEFFSLIPEQLSSGSLVLGGFLMAIGLHRKFYFSNILKRGTRTEGKVIEVRQNPGSLFSKEVGAGFAPVVEYTNNSGNTLIHHSTTYRTPSMYKENQTVPIWYINYKSRREAALQDDEPGTWPMKLIGVGFVLFLVGVPQLLQRLALFI